MPKYSFIVPVYQCHDDLLACVNSILCQEIPDFELVLVDDGSPDQSGQLCDDLAVEDSRIRVFHKENGGAASARNMGLVQATGEYVIFIDGDDCIAKHFLRVIDPSVRKAELLIFGMSFCYYRAGRLVRTQNLSCGKTGPWDLSELAADFGASFRNNELSSACNKVFDLSLIRQLSLRFREGMTLYEDFDFVLRYLSAAEKICYVDEPLYRYRNELDRPHINRRLSDTDSMRNNLRLLNASLLSLHEKYPSAEILSTGANLCLTLLQQYLLQTRPLRAKRLSQVLPAYCAEESFLQLLEHGGLPEVGQNALLEMVRQGQFRRICSVTRRKRLKLQAKKAVKHLLGKG